MARDMITTDVKSETVLSIIINILARCISGTAPAPASHDACDRAANQQIRKNRKHERDD